MAGMKESIIVDSKVFSITGKSAEYEARSMKSCCSRSAKPWNQDAGGLPMR